MKRSLFLSSALLVPLLALAGSPATATIDSACTPHNATLVVPAGQTASGFSVAALTNGSKCVVGGVPDNKGWGITNSAGAKVYAWSQWQRGAPSEVGGALAGLTLGAGTYAIYVDGGNGAAATINYTLK